MALQEFVATHPSWFVDYIMMDGILLDGAWESGGIFVQKVEKGDEQFVGDRFVYKRWSLEISQLIRGQLITTTLSSEGCSV